MLLWGPKHKSFPRLKTSGKKKYAVPGCAPSSITWSLEVSCPPEIVLVAKEIRVEGVSFPGTYTPKNAHISVNTNSLYQEICGLHMILNS